MARYGSTPATLIQESSDRKTWWRRLGRYTVLIFTLGTLGTLLVTFFLSFLWFARSSAFWRQLMAAGWAGRLITLATLVLRWSVAGQATICTSMLAALALEQSGVCLSQVAKVSAIRFLNSGPINLLFPVLRNGPPISKFSVIPVSLALLLITSTLLQFASTALLSDLATSVVAGSAESRILRYGINYTTANPSSLYSVDLWSTKPPSYPSFSEYSEDRFVDDTVFDTGVTLRALLPIASERARSFLSDFSGLATVFDSRVVCLRPLIRAEIQISQLYHTLTLVGKLRPSHNVSGLVLNFSDAGFNCSVAEPLGVVYFTPEWMTTLCRLDTNIGYTDNPFYGTRLPSVAYLVINNTAGYGTWSTWQNESRTWSNFDDFIQQGNGEWLDMYHSTDDGKLSVTLCFHSFITSEKVIKAISLTNRTEPVLDYNVQEKVYDTNAVRKQLGATTKNLTLSERGLLSLQPKKSWAVDTSPLISFPLPMVEQGLKGVNESIMFCVRCNGGAKTVHSAHQMLFYETLRETGRPALAIQALYTTLIQMAYYSRILEFDVAASAEVRNFIEVQTPQRFSGFTAVIVVISLHLILIFIIAANFITGTRFTLLGESWQVMTQIWSPVTEFLFIRGTFVSDEDIARGLDAEHRKLVTIKRAKDSDRVEVQIIRTGCRAETVDAESHLQEDDVMSLDSGILHVED